jgi:hypothetical protein
VEADELADIRLVFHHQNASGLFHRLFISRSPAFHNCAVK